ncbi:MAG: hypothetical protein KKI06_00910 [Euryarchaeota archaeon]|nr:hypothetical protein [Euryarchaeota archaeon]
MKNDESAISEVMALLMLVMVAVSASAAYYVWIANLQQEVQTTGSEIAETRLNTFMSEIEVVSYPEYVYYNIDSKPDGKITVNESFDERFIQEIQVLVINKALFNLTNVKVKALSFGNGSIEWAGLQFDRSTVRRYDRKLLERPFREDDGYRLDGNLTYFTSQNKTNTSMKFITDEGYSYFAKNSSYDINTTSLTDLTPLHNPTYTIGNISKAGRGTGYMYILINSSALPVNTNLKLYITNDQGVDAYRTIHFSINR